MRVDLNSDLGEGFGIWPLGDDEAMVGLVTSANLACGFHAGDPRTLLQTCRWAVEQGVSIGAQVAYRDLAGFGRRFIDVDPADLTADVIYQIGALQGLAAGRRRTRLLRQAARCALQHDRAPRGAGRGGGRGRDVLRPRRCRCSACPAPGGWRSPARPG